MKMKFDSLISALLIFVMALVIGIVIGIEIADVKRDQFETQVKFVADELHAQKNLQSAKQHAEGNH